MVLRREDVPLALLALSALLWAAAPVVAQEPIESRARLAADGYVKIWSGDGTVRVIGWDRDSVSVTGARRPGPGRFFHQVDGGTAKLGFEVPEERAGDVHAELEVRVPRETGVWIRAVGAAVVVRGVLGSVDAFTVRGPIEIHDSPARVGVESMAGDIALRLEESEVVRIEGGAGGVTFRGAASDLAIETIEGRIDVEQEAPRRVALESIDGAIRYRGGLAVGGILEADTHAGDIELRLDPDVSAAIDLASVEGRVEADERLASPSGSAFRGSRLVGELGTGAGEIVARSYLGDVNLHLGTERNR